MVPGNKQNKSTNKKEFCLEKFTGEVFLNSAKNVYLWALVKTQKMDEAKQIFIKFLRQQVIHRMKLHSNWATRSLLLKEFATDVKKQFTGEQVENRQVKKFPYRNQRIVAGFAKKLVCQF